MNGDPYRDNPLHKLEDKVNALVTETDARFSEFDKSVTKLQKSYDRLTKREWPIASSIAEKIRKFDLDTLFGILFIALLSTLAIAGLAAIYMVSVSDELADSCLFTTNTVNKNDDGTETKQLWYVTLQIDWAEDQKIGPFDDLDLAKKTAVLNHCPNVQ